jgi:prevent-host-death family protein
MTVNIDQAKSSLKELIGRTADGEKVVITEGGRPVAELIPVKAPNPSPRYGSCRGMLEIVSEDVEHLDDFRDYGS